MYGHWRKICCDLIFFFWGGGFASIRYGDSAAVRFSLGVQLSSQSGVRFYCGSIIRSSVTLFIYRLKIVREIFPLNSFFALLSSGRTNKNVFVSYFDGFGHTFVVFCFVFLLFTQSHLPVYKEFYFFLFFYLLFYLFS